MHQQRLDGVASRRILNLRIHREGYSLVQVRRAIDKHVTDSLAMAQDGDPAVLLDEGNKLFRASGNQQVDFPLEPQQLHHVRTRLEHRKRFLRHIGKPAKRLSPDVHDRFVAVCGFCPALEQDGIAGFEPERRNLWNDIGPGFKDDCNHTERTGFLMQDEALVEFRGRQPFSNGSGRFATSRTRAAISAMPLSLIRRRENKAWVISPLDSSFSATDRSRRLAARIREPLSSSASAIPARVLLRVSPESSASFLDAARAERASERTSAGEVVDVVSLKLHAPGERYYLE